MRIVRRVYNKLLSDRLYFAVFASGKPREEVRCSRVTLLRSSHCFSGRALPFPVPLPAQGRASLENPDAEASPLIYFYGLFMRCFKPPVLFVQIVTNVTDKMTILIFTFFLIRV